MSVSSILVHCNIIHSSYMLGTQAPVAYNFFPNAAPGQKILEAPHHLIYLPVTVDVISTLSVWLMDQHGKLMLYHSLLVYYLPSCQDLQLVVVVSEMDSICTNMINVIEYKNVKAMVSI